MPINPGLYPESTWFLAVQFRHKNGTPIDVSGTRPIARFYAVAGGEPIFICDNEEDAGEGVGTFYMDQAGITGVGDTGGVLAAILTAEQRAAIFTGSTRYLWTWHNRTAQWGETFLAEGYIDVPLSGQLNGGFHVENSFDGTTATPVVIAIPADPAGIREQLTGDRTYWVRADGSDDNDGSANDENSAFLTIQKAIDVLRDIDLQGFGVTIRLGVPGTYTGTVVAYGNFVGQGLPYVTILGDTAAPENYIISVTGNAITADMGAKLDVSGVKIVATGTALNALRTSEIRVRGKVDFGACGIHMSANQHSLISIVSEYTVSGGAAHHGIARLNSVIVAGAFAVTFIGTPAFSTAMFEARNSSNISTPQTFSGAMSGRLSFEQALGVCQITNVPTGATFGAGYTHEYGFNTAVARTAATTTTLRTTASNFVRIEGSDTIEFFGDAPAGMDRWCRIDDHPTLKYSANLITHTGGDVPASPGDRFRVISEGSNVWRIWVYETASAGGGMANCFTAISDKGSIISAPIRSQTAFVIDEIFQTPDDTTISARTKSVHSYTSGDTVTVRSGGAHAISWRRHPANGTWIITVVDTKTFILATRATAEQEHLVGDPSDWGAGGHRFVRNGAISYKSLVDCRAEWVRLTMWLHDNGGGRLIIPPGVFAFTTRDGRGAWNCYIPSGVKIECAGTDTHLFKGDGILGYFVYFGKIPDLFDHGADNMSVVGGVWNGNRAYQPRNGGYHNFRGALNRNLTFKNMWTVNSAGYGGSFGGGDDTYYINVTLDDIVIWDADSDGWDTKNRSASNTAFYVSNIKVFGHGLGNIGTCNGDRALAADPITTVSGSSIVTVSVAGAEEASPLSTRPKVGAPVTLYGLTSVGGIDPNGTWICTEVTGGNLYKFDSGQTASSSAMGGGSGGHMDAPAHSPGDAGFDGRAFMNVNGIFVQGPLCGSLVGIRGRPGSEVIETHWGSQWSNWTNLWCEDTGEFVTPSLINSSIGVQIDADNSNVTNIVSRKAARGFYAGAQSEHTQITNIQCFENDVGLMLRGNECSYSDIQAKDCVTAVRVEGYVTNITTEIFNPFTTVAGSPYITVEFVAHGLTVPSEVAFYHTEGGDVTVGGSGALNGEFWPVVEIIDADHFVIRVETDLAPTLDIEEGGGSPQIIYPGFLANAERNRIIDLRATGTTGVAFDLTSSSVDTVIKDCASTDLDGGSHYSDLGVRTDWEGRNRNLPQSNILTHSLNLDVTVVNSIDEAWLTAPITATRTATIAAPTGPNARKSIIRASTATGAFTWAIRGPGSVLIKNMPDPGYRLDMRSLDGTSWESAGLIAL